MVEADEVACARSPCSTSTTFSPRPAASRAMPQPLIPPPITARSKTPLTSATSATATSTPARAQASAKARGGAASVTKAWMSATSQIRTGALRSNFSASATRIVRRAFSTIARATATSRMS